MTAFRVWAPRAASVAVHVEGGARPLAPAEGGWWALAAEDLAPEVDYRFSLDGGEPLPDPRSPWQPEGVFGPSRTLDERALRFEVDRWETAPLSRAVLYELHVGTFTPEGTFEAAIERLDHLVELGVTHLELMPVAEFPGRRGWGYDGVFPYAPHHAYGGPRGLARLVDACHARGLGVLLDVVYNHLGPLGNVLSRFGPYFTDRYATPWGSAPNLDGEGADETRRFFLDNARTWLERYRFDGLRLDAVHAILDTSALHFVEELAAEVHALGQELGRPLLVIAEDDRNDPRLVAPRALGGFGCDARWNDDFHHALAAALTSERAGYYVDFGSLADLAAALERVQVYSGRYSAFRRRTHGRPVDDFGEPPGERFLAYAQNHDQVGNRPQGERLGAIVDPALLPIAAALVILSPYVPLLFQGEEWGTTAPFPYFTDHPDAELGRAVREGRRRELAGFGWPAGDAPDPQDERTFRSAVLDWDERAREPHATLLAWHRDLLALRRTHPDLGTDRANVRVRFDEEARWLVLRRGHLALCCNLSGTPLAVPGLAGGRVLAASAPPRAAHADALELEGPAAMVVETPGSASAVP